MQTVSAARRQALALIDQAPPIGLKVVDYWGSGWCRLRIETPQGAPRITSATYEWLKDQGLITESRYGRPVTTGLERNRRYATLTDAGRAVLTGSSAPTQVGRLNIGESLRSPHGSWTVAASWIADKPGAPDKERDYRSPFLSPGRDSHVHYLLTRADGSQEEWSAPDMADTGFHRAPSAG